MSVILTCDSLGKSFGSRTVFSGVSLSLHEGDRLGIIGPNGAGKSTFLQILGGAMQADDGTVSVRKGVRVAMVVQDPYQMGYTGVKLLHRLITGDKAGAEELLKGSDMIDTGLKVIVPNDKSPAKSKFRMTLSEFKSWLAEKGLEGS